MSNSSYRRVTKREPKIPDQGRRMSNYKLKRTNTLSSSIESGFYAIDNDITQLKEVTEKSLLSTLKARFSNDFIYTYAGPILISINPYQYLPIYNPKYIKFYQGAKMHELPPHVFAIADAAYQSMLREGLNQCIVIGGESGSGKTETTKFLLNHLTNLSGMLLPLDILDHILYAGPILEAFGNATTRDNHNSSRFGKYITLCFKENGTYRGAYIDKYLLEQCRIVSQAEGERNFHVFYYLLCGASEQMKQELFLDTKTHYGYLSRHSSINPSKDDSEGYMRLCNLLTSLRFEDHIQFNIFSILSAILHLGNLTFKNSDTPPDTANELTPVSQLLKVPLELLTLTLTNRQRSVGNDKILIPCTHDQKMYTRDALAKALYSSLFDWILFRINDILNGRVARRECQLRMIGILDIFGFENVSRNSFEQFCINYANEQLHHYFINFVLKLEQDEYINDKIDWRYISYKDNEECIDLFAKRPKGMFILINDESSIPAGSDLSLYEKFISNHKMSPYFKTPQLKQQSPIFTVSHFAGSVTYHINQFIEKNKDLMSKSVVDLLRTSEDRLIRELIGAEPIGRMKWQKLGLVFKAATLFKSSLTPRVTSPPIPPRSDKFKIPPTTFNASFPRGDHEGQVAGSRSLAPFHQVSRNRREGEAVGNCIRFIQSYNPTETPRRRFSNKRRSKNKSLERKSKSKPEPESRSRFNSFDIQELRGAPTVVSQYQTSLQKLMQQLSSSNPFFIKCIRSNTSQQPKHFSDEAVKHQLGYSGLFEAIKVRQAGYSIRMPFQDFLSKYQPIVKQMANDTRPLEVLISDFLRQQYLPFNSYQIGKTKVFIRELEGQKLDERLNTILLQRVVFLQKSVRIWLEKRRFARFKKSVTEVQACSRGYLLRSVVQKKLSAVISIQSVWRGFYVRRAISLMKEGKIDYKKILRTSRRRNHFQNGDLILTKGGNRVLYPPGKEKLRNRRSMFEGADLKTSPRMRGTTSLSITNSNPFRLSYMEAIQTQQKTKFESRENDSSKYDLSRVKRLYENNVLTPVHHKGRCESVDLSTLRPGSVNDIVRGLEFVNPRSKSVQKRISKTMPRTNTEPLDDYIFAPGIAKSPVSYSKSYDFGDTSFAPLPPPRIAPKDIFNKLLKTHSTFLNNMPLDREAIYKQNTSLHFSNSARFNTELLLEKLTTPLPTNYNHARVKRSRAKPVVRREAIRVTSPGVERPYLLPSSPLTSAHNFFPKVIHEDDNCDSYTLMKCVSTSQISRKKRELDGVKIKSLSSISPFEMIFQGKNQTENPQPSSLYKSSISLTKSAGNRPDYIDLLRPRAVTVSTLNSGSKGFSRSLQMSREKLTDSPIHISATVQSKIYAFTSPFKRDKPRKTKGKVQLTNYAHGHEPKPYITFQKTSCSKCNRALHAPFHKRSVYKCALCNLVFHENCMQFANNCIASSGDVVIARNLSDLSKLISFLLDKKDTLSERPRQKDTMDDFYILALERMHASMLTNTSLRAQTFSEEATQIKTQTITIGNVLHDFTLLLSPLVSDTKSQLVLRNVFMNLLEDFLLEKSREDSDPNSTVAPQAVKVLKRRKEIQKPKLIYGHTFLEKHFNVLTVCELCNVPMSLVEPGQFCKTCDYVAHKSCLASIKTHCVTNNCESIDLDDPKTEKLSHFGRSLTSLSKSHTGLPKVFELCLKSIESTGLVAEGIYRKSSAKTKVVRMINQINEDFENVDWESVGVHTVCSVLKNFLSELPEPLITFDLYDKCILAAKMTERPEKLRAIQAIVQLLPPLHYNCLERLIFHLAQVSKGEEHNKMSPHCLAIIFAPVLLRAPEEMPMIELARMVPLQTAILQIIIEEQLKKFKDTMQDLEQLDRNRRDTIRKMKQLAHDDNKSDSGIFDQPIQDDVSQAAYWKQLSTQLAKIESHKFSLTFELARLELGESSNEDSSSHDSIEATI